MEAEEAEEARALFELQLELHQLALGLRPNISSDEMIELRSLMEADNPDGLPGLSPAGHPDSV